MNAVLARRHTLLSPKGTVLAWGRARLTTRTALLAQTHAVLSKSDAAVAANRAVLARSPARLEKGTALLVEEPSRLAPTLAIVTEGSTPLYVTRAPLRVAGFFLAKAFMRRSHGDRALSEDDGSFDGKLRSTPQAPLDIGGTPLEHPNDDRGLGRDTPKPPHFYFAASEPPNRNGALTRVAAL